MFTKIEANRLQINDDYKNTFDTLVERAKVDESSDPSSDADAVKADFGLYQSQNARVEHPVLREQPQYLLVADKKETKPKPTSDSHNVDVRPDVVVKTSAVQIDTVNVNFGSCSLDTSGTEADDDTSEQVFPITGGGNEDHPIP